MSKQTVKKYRTTASAILDRYGAKLGDVFHTGSLWYKLNGATVAVMDEWVAIRLPKHMIASTAAAHHDKPNPYSGKWNIHADTAEMDELRRRLEWISKQ